MNSEEQLEKLAKEGLTGLDRAAKAAEEIARKTGTPLVVWREGRVVDLNAETTTRYQRTEAEPARLREEPEEPSES